MEEHVETAEAEETAVEIEAAAFIAHAGLDLHRFLTLTDPLERLVWQRVAARVLDRRDDERRELAVEIRNQIVEAIK